MIELANQLTPNEVGQLLHYEGVVATNLRGFELAGEALAEIRDRQLYRAAHPTFEAYLGARWSLSRRRGYQLIEESEAAGDVHRGTHGELMITSGRAARELAQLDTPEERVEVARETAARTGGVITGPEVAATIAQREELRGRDDEAAIAFLDDHRKRKGGAIATAPGPAAPADDQVEKKPPGDEWYTPDTEKRPFLRAVRAVMGGIDLDPASCAKANENVQATEYFTKDADGLAQAWCAARLFLNPPYSGTDAWVDKLLLSHAAGLVAEAILLVNVNSSTEWFEKLWDASPAMCFVRGRIQFEAGEERPTKDGKKAPVNGWSPSVFVYLGDRPAVFASEFERFGRIARAVSVEDLA